MNDTRIDYLLANGYQFSIGSIVNRGMALFQRQQGAAIGNFFLLGLLFFAGAIILSFIPFAANIITPIIGAGCYFACHEVAQNRPFRFESFFEGFRRSDIIAPLIINTLIQQMIMLVFFIPFIIPYIYIMRYVISHGDTSDDMINELVQNGKGLSVVLGFVAYLLVISIPLTYLTVAWSLAVPLAAFRRRPIWTALEESRKIVNQHWWTMFGLQFVMGLINMAGALCLYIGLIFTVPLTIFISYAVYEQIVGFDDDKDNNPDELMRHFGQPV